MAIVNQFGETWCIDNDEHAPCVKCYLGDACPGCPIVTIYRKYFMKKKN